MSDEAKKKMKIILTRGCVIDGEKVKAFTACTVSRGDAISMINAKRAVEDNADNRKVIDDMKKEAAKAAKAEAAKAAAADATVEELESSLERALDELASFKERLEAAETELAASKGDSK